jgi:hypothetical protein
MSLSTVTLQNVINLCSTHAELMLLSGASGYTNEPALSLANDTLQELLSFPYAWKFNRVEMPMFVTSQNKQDYQFGGAVAFTLGSSSTGVGIALATAGTPGISRTGTTVTVNTLEAHNMSVGNTVYMLGNGDSQFNSTYTQSATIWGFTSGWTILSVPSSTSFTFTHATSGTTTSGASGITDFGWLQSGTMVELNNASPLQNLQYLQAEKELQPDFISENPKKVCVLKDNGDGTLKIRFQHVPSSTIWGANLVYQAKAPLKAALTDTWAPFPDDFGFVYRQMFLARCYRYINSPRSEVEYQKAQAMIIKALGKGDAETTEVHVVPARSLMDW